MGEYADDAICDSLNSYLYWGDYGDDGHRSRYRRRPQRKPNVARPEEFAEFVQQGEMRID